MAYRYHGRTDSYTSAWGICDRCNFTYNLNKLNWQYEYGGVGLYNTKLRVCSKCMDVPQEQFKSIRIPADPIPVRNPRPNQFSQQMGNASPLLTWDTAEGRWDDSTSVWLSP